jgi:HAT1-interacting factor 1
MFTGNAVAGPSTAPTAPVTAASIQFSFGGDAEDEEGEEEEEEEEAPTTTTGDREDDLEMAFLMLDTARATWEKVQGIEAKKKLVEVHRLLGDVASESGSFFFS